MSRKSNHAPLGAEITCVYRWSIARSKTPKSKFEAECGFLFNNKKRRKGLAKVINAYLLARKLEICTPTVSEYREAARKFQKSLERAIKVLRPRNSRGQMLELDDDLAREASALGQLRVAIDAGARKHLGLRKRKRLPKITVLGAIRRAAYDVLEDFEKQVLNDPGSDAWAGFAYGLRLFLECYSGKPVKLTSPSMIGLILLVTSELRSFLEAEASKYLGYGLNNEDAAKKALSRLERKNRGTIKVQK